jgi:hypothetical protein
VKIYNSAQTSNRLFKEENCQVVLLQLFDRLQAVKQKKRSPSSHKSPPESDFVYRLALRVIEKSIPECDEGWYFKAFKELFCLNDNLIIRSWVLLSILNLMKGKLDAAEQKKNLASQVPNLSSTFCYERAKENFKGLSCRKIWSLVEFKFHLLSSAFLKYNIHHEHALKNNEWNCKWWWRVRREKWKSINCHSWASS